MHADMDVHTHCPLIDLSLSLLGYTRLATKGIEAGPYLMSRSVTDPLHPPTTVLKYC